MTNKRGKGGGVTRSRERKWMRVARDFSASWRLIWKGILLAGRSNSPLYQPHIISGLFSGELIRLQNRTASRCPLHQNKFAPFPQLLLWETFRNPIMLSISRPATHAHAGSCIRAWWDGKSLWEACQGPDEHLVGYRMRHAKGFSVNREGEAGERGAGRWGSPAWTVSFVRRRNKCCS